MKLRYAIGGIVAAALIALPASAAAKQGGGQLNRLTAQQCAQERAQVGKKTFRKKYGAKHPMRACIKRTFTQVAAAAGTAGQSCQTELSLEGALEFVDTYGDEPSDSLDYALAECVAEAVDEILNPDTGVPDLDDE